MTRGFEKKLWVDKDRINTMSGKGGKNIVLMKINYALKLKFKTDNGGIVTLGPELLAFKDKSG